MSSGKLLAGAALALVLGLGAAEAAPASPAAIAAATASDGAAVEQVQYRRYYGPRRYYRGYGPGIGLGIGAAVIAGAIIADRAYRPRPGYYYNDYAYDGPYYYPSDYQGDPRRICAQHFRSFEWNTGLYTAYSGEKRLCPYLK